MKANSLTQNAINIVQSKGKFAIEQACQKILENNYDNGVIREALHFYAKNVLPKVLPIFPALIYLSSKAVGGNPEKVKPIATAMLLITASGDIHDDIVDNSKQKFERKTIVGKYGKDVALLAGDALIVQGMAALQNESQSLTCEQMKIINDFIVASMFDVVKAEAVESALWQKKNVMSKEFFEVIQLKGAIAETHCKIGGVIGGADKEAIDNLGCYGRVIGILSTLKEEFVDIASPTELLHRIKYELPPYPMLCAMQNKEVGSKICAITKKAHHTIEDLHAVAALVMRSSEIEELSAEFRRFGKKELTHNPLLKDNELARELVELLEALTEDLLLV